MKKSELNSLIQELVASEITVGHNSRKRADDIDYKKFHDIPKTQDKYKSEAGVYYLNDKDIAAITEIVIEKLTVKSGLRTSSDGRLAQSLKQMLPIVIRKVADRSSTKKQKEFMPANESVMSDIALHIDSFVDDFVTGAIKIFNNDILPGAKDARKEFAIKNFKYALLKKISDEIDLKLSI